MPRQDVPYGGAICRLRERIAEIFDKLGEKLHTINGVPGDGNGNVKIVSGSSAVVITNDPTQNEISVALDTSQLPAASISSVNGQTGAVALDAGDIPSDGNSDVQSDIDALQTMDGALQGNINAEALARQNADSTLQSNINTVSASLPSAAATAVANDPTVAQLATDVPNKVDKITSGSSLKAYTHTGATQGETSVVDGTAANSIGIRNANGRMQAADPASGATDKTLVTANWVSQTGDSGPNNLLHKNGNETKTGVLTIERLITRSFYFYARTGGTTNTWRHMATVSGTNNARVWGILHYNQSQRFAFFEIHLGPNPKFYLFVKKNVDVNNVAINYDGNDNYYIMIRTPYSYQTGSIMPLMIQSNDQINPSVYQDVTNGTIYNNATDFPLANTVYGQFEGVDNA